MYEDAKGNKMVVVRWFHKIDVVGLPHDFNDREIFFSLCLQDLSIECLDGLAMVLSPEHYAKFHSVAKHSQLDPYMCNRQYDNDDLTPFDVTQVKGYWKQDILRYMLSLSLSTSLNPICLPEDSRKPRKRLCLSHDCNLDLPCSARNDAVNIDDFASQRNYILTQGPRVMESRMEVKVEAPQQATVVGSVVEVLSQDSGLRCCRFNATIFKKHKNKIKLSYHDIKDAENEEKWLEEWVMASRIALSDALGLRLDGRTTIRPSFPSHRGKISWAFNVGAVVDARQHDGWWEGIIVQKQPDESFRVYFPGEKRDAVVSRSDLRHSQEWIGNTWKELSEKPDVAASILSGLVKGESTECDNKNPDCDIRKEVSSSNMHENNNVVPHLSEDSLLSRLKWKTLRKRRRSCFSVQKLHPRGNRVNLERTLFHSTMKVGKENLDTCKFDHDNCNYKVDPLFRPSVVPPPPLTSLVMSQ